MRGPRIESWMPPEEQNFRRQFPKLIETINHSSILPYQIGDDYIVFPTGQRSIVAHINPGQVHQAVIKTSLDQSSITYEASALTHWSHVVTTPQITYLNEPNSIIPTSFFVSEYVTSPRLKETPAPQRIAEKLSKRMGETLSLIHSQPQTPELKTPNQTTADMICKDVLDTTTRLIAANILRPADQKIIENEISLIESKILLPVLGHGDFLAYNLFNDNGRLTVFDPQVIVISPMHDLANTMVNTVAEVLGHGIDEANEILNGYGQKSTVDTRLMHAFFRTQCVKKIERWYRKDLYDKVERTIGYFRNIPI